MGFLTAAAGTFSVGDTLYKLAVESGFAGSWSWTAAGETSS